MQQAFRGEVRWLIAAMMFAMVVVVFSPYVERQRWPFASQLASLRGPTADEIADAVSRNMPSRQQSHRADEVAAAVISRLPKQPISQAPASPRSRVTAICKYFLHENLQNGMLPKESNDSLSEMK